MKRRARARRRRRVDQVEDLPPMSGLRIRINYVARDDTRHCMIDVDATQLQLMQQFNSRPLRLADLEIEISKDAT